MDTLTQPRGGAGPRAEAAPSSALRLRAVSKKYRRRRALDGLDLTVPLGGVHALLGPNGSGKTTTLRIALGLARSSAGSVEVLGHPVPRQLATISHRVGAVIECPNFYPNFSARRNLEILNRAIGGTRERVDSALERLGLAGCADQSTRTLSLGMRQRLAIAATTLKSPDLYIFDEPTNGLDPASIIDLRGLMRTLSGEGATVLLSTHLLSEVQQVADSVSIIDRGRSVFEGSLQELARATNPTLRVGVNDADRAARILREHDYQVDLADDGLEVHGDLDRSATARITAILAREGLYIFELSPARGLESSFLELTGRTGS